MVGHMINAIAQEQIEHRTGRSLKLAVAMHQRAGERLVARLECRSEVRKEFIGVLSIQTDQRVGEGERVRADGLALTSGVAGRQWTVPRRRNIARPKRRRLWRRRNLRAR